MRNDRLFFDAPRPIQGFALLAMAYPFLSMFVGGNFGELGFLALLLLRLTVHGLLVYWVLLRRRAAWVLCCVFAGLVILRDLTLLLIVTQRFPEASSILALRIFIALYTLFALGNADSLRYRDYGPAPIGLH